jgi:hypothetical protein
MEMAAFLAPATITGTACRDGRMRVNASPGPDGPGAANRT